MPGNYNIKAWAPLGESARMEAEGAGVRKTVGAIAMSHATGAVMFRLCCRRVLAKVALVDQASGGLNPQRRTAM